MKTAILLTALGAVLAAMSSFPAQAAAAAQEKEGAMTSAFATDLYRQLAAKDGNLFFSPASIQIALAMTWAGARGVTADEMAATLHLDRQAANDQFGGFLRQLNADGQKGGYELSVANALWGANGYPFVPDYVALVKSLYAGGLRDVDFAHDPEGARKTINDWAADQTHDRIKDLLPPGLVNADTRLVLTNAIYFKAAWDERFNKRATADADFLLAGGGRARVPMMYQQAHFRYAQDDTAQLLELSYGSGDLVMRVLLPRRPDGLLEVEKAMVSGGTLAALAAKLGREEVRVWLPRFRVESQFSLADTLAAMGMPAAFDSRKADFSGMSSAERTFISAVVHKAFVNVDEEGTEAAAATAVAMRAMAMPMRPAEPKQFRADHPFVFQIVHQPTGAVLFMGRVARP